MKYEDGMAVRVGDRIVLKNGEHALVVLSIDMREESEDYKLEDWSNLDDGVLVKTARGVIVVFHGDVGDKFRKL